MATYRNSTSKVVLDTTPMRLGGGELFSGLSGGVYSGPSGTKKSSGGGGSTGEAYVPLAAPVVDQTARFNGLFKEMTGSTFQPHTVTYTQESEESIASAIAAWLLPGYEQAIAERQERTRGYAAELDADAISRGMGASTYVTDVKSRQQRDEASDIAILRSEYGATLAQNVSERLSKEKDRALEADMFNAEAKQNAYALAYQATVLLMELGAVAHETY